MKLASINFRNLMNGLYIRAKFNSYIDFQYKNSNEILKFKQDRLRSILKYAIDEVPYYSYLKDKINFTDFTFDELEKFPIVTKSIIRDNYHDFIARKYKNKSLEFKATSGSSGEPFKVPKTFFSDGIEQCIMFRAWSMNPEYNYSFRDPCIVLRSFSPRQGEKPYKIDPILNYWYLSPFDINDSTIKLYYDIIVKSKARLIRAYPSSLYIFTLYLKKFNLVLPQIKTLFTSSENLIPIYRKTIESYWKIPLIDWYGQNERTAIAQMCEFGTYHNNDDYGHIELDVNNQIIATSFNNDVMPLIRYATSDIAQPTNKTKCECGRGFSIPFQGIDGRADDLLMKDDGTIIATVNIYNAMEQFQTVKQFKIVQNQDKSILLQVVPGENFNKDIITLIENDIRQRLGDILIKTEILSEIERDRFTGKIKSIVSNINHNLC